MRYIIVHHGDWDGIVAAWVCKQALQGRKVADEDIEVYGIQYKQPFEVDITGAVVYILDFSFPPDVFWPMFESAKRVVMLDHHQTALEAWYKNHPENRTQKDAFAKYVYEGDISIWIADGVAGCELTWRWFYKNERMPQLVQYAADHDLWKFALADSHKVRAIMRSYKQSLESCDILDALLEGQEGSWDEAMAEGKAIMRYQDGLVETAVRHAEQFEIGGVLCLGTQVAFDGLISLVAGKLAETAEEERKGFFGFCWFKSKGHMYVYSLRSRGDFDVSEVAKKMGGGGHAKAAGFSTNLPPTKFLAAYVEARRKAEVENGDVQ
jgi:oligoribonuclease NrnB/cAMP/cGMP phosphodiesterase (DHH superfamily)